MREVKAGHQTFSQKRFEFVEDLRLEDYASEVL